MCYYYFFSIKFKRHTNRSCRETRVFATCTRLWTADRTSLLFSTLPTHAQMNKRRTYRIYIYLYRAQWQSTNQCPDRTKTRSTNTPFHVDDHHVAFVDDGEQLQLSVRKTPQYSIFFIPDVFGSNDIIRNYEFDFHGRPFETSAWHDSTSPANVPRVGII